MKNLKLLRESRGFSQQKLADEFHISQQSIYKYENGLAEPDLETLKSMATFFHTSIDYLIGNVDKSDNQEICKTSEVPLTGNELHYLNLYHNLDTEVQRHINAILELIIENQKTDVDK